MRSIKIDEFLHQHTPWGKQRMRLIDYVFLKKLRRIQLRLRTLPHYKDEDITVVIAVRNIFDYKLIHALESIRKQDYEQHLIRIVLVDYGSTKDYIPKYNQLCKEHRAELIRIDNRPTWCRSHALNVGIKRAYTKYILSTDADIVFESNYFKEAIKELMRDPYQYILARCLDAPENADRENDYYKLKMLSSYRYGFTSKGINMTLTYYYHKINGYDEKYIEWGYEDEDLIKRFWLFGLKKKDISHVSSYIHLWHPKYRGVCNLERIQSNKEYYENNHSIIRNKDGWGEIK